jgi:diguanylate cyclase
LFGAVLVVLKLAGPAQPALLRELYLPLHTAMEVFAVLVAMMIFAVGWHSVGGQRKRSVTLLSAAFFAVGLLDFGHFMSVPGMPAFVTPSSVSKGIDFWLAARATSAAALLVVALLPWGSHSAPRTAAVALAGCGALAALVYALVLGRPDWIPETYAVGVGLTPFKLGSEYALVALYLLAAALLLRRARAKPTRSTYCLVAAAAVMALSELCFAWYVRADDLFNFIGHVYKVVAYLFLYRAIFVTSVREPYRLLHRSERSLAEQLRCDALTGLPNRLGIGELLRAAQAGAPAGAGPRRLALHFFDIDFFNRVNQSFGHTAADGVLCECVRRLAGALPPGATLGRQSGDAFVVLQSGADQARAAALAEALLKCMREPFFVQGHEVFLNASLGIALDGAGPGDLLQQAHVAVAAVKRDGGNAYRFHAPQMAQQIRARLRMERDLRLALERGELQLHYQPRVCAANGAVLGAEALLRWAHPTLGMVSPAEFIPVAEESGLIEPIGLWVLGEACRQARRWQDAGLAPLCVSVNLSARQFQQADLVRQIGAALADSGLDARYLELEITEGTVMHDTTAAVATMHALKRLGVTLSIDDFGTGYSSLSYLKLFPIDVLKIDRSFVTDVTRDPNDAAITHAIIGLAHWLGLFVVAEGVETLEQARFLAAAGCDEFQGYYLSRPLAPLQFAALLADAGRAPAAALWQAGAAAALAEEAA